MKQLVFNLYVIGHTVSQQISKIDTQSCVYMLRLCKGFLFYFSFLILFFFKDLLVFCHGVEQYIQQRACF